MSSKPWLRKRFFVDRRVQGTLVVRVVLYWLACLVTISLLLLYWRMLTGPLQPFAAHVADLWYLYGPAAVASLAILPMVVVDVVRTSNRFAGPILRLRRAMQALAQGEQVEPVRFRDADFWHEFAEDFNAVAARVQASSRSHADGKRLADPETVDGELVGAGSER